MATRAAMSAASDEERKLMADPFALGGFVPEFDRNGVKDVSIKGGTGEVTAKGRKEDNDAALAKMSQCPYTGVYRAPNVYAFFDTRIVRRSNALFADLENKPYGKFFNFQEFSMMPPEAMAAMAGGASVAATSTSGEKEQLEQAGKYYKQGDGPMLEDLDGAWTGVFLWAQSTSGHEARCSLIGRDGYFETARCAVETAMTLRFDHGELPHKGGVLNAAVAGQTWLARRLVDSGVKFNMSGWFAPEDMSPPPF